MESGPRQRTVHERSIRLAWALLASLLAHLALIGDIANLHWWQPAIPANPMPLEVQLMPAEDEKISPVAIERREAPPEAPPQPAAEPLPLSISANPENAVSIDPPGAMQEAYPANPIASPVLQIPGEQKDDGILQRLPPSGNLVYRFYWGKSRWLAGLATHQWVIDNGNYTLSSNVRTTGIFELIHPVRLVETSQGTVSGERLRPQMFITQLNEFPPAISYFNWDKGYFRWYRGTTSFAQPLPANAYDKISFLYQLYISPEKENFYSTDITMGRRLEHYQIENLGVEDIEIDGKAYPSMHLRRVTSSADMEQVEIWLSTADNLPVRMIYSNNAGDHFEQLIAAESIPVKSNQ